MVSNGRPAGSRNLRTIVIGAGMAGLLVGIKLKERGDENFVIFEKGASIGGTWRENRYPGLSCDTPAHSYAYSFAYNPDWSAYFAPGPEIKQYFENMADRFAVRDHIRFNAEVVECRWTGARWEITLQDGHTDFADVIYCATGVLHHPKYPDIPGMDSFKGAIFHSARWDQSVPLEGQRIGVIGGGSTGVQIVTALAGQAANLVHLVRTTQWIMPCPETVYSDEDRKAFRDDPSLIEEVREGPEANARRARFQAAVIDVNSMELQEIQKIVEKNLEDSVPDPVLREKLRPNYRAACKRMIFSPTYYKAMQSPGVVLETGAIAHVEEDGVRMKDGTFHALDVIALATGFDVTRFCRPMKISGQNGADLDGFWQPNPRAYFAVTMPDFPNFFLLNGPTAPVGNFSLIDIAERQWAYLDQLVELLRRGDIRAVSPSRAALQRYEAARDKQAMNTVFASGCSSWYLDAHGVPQVWPWSISYFIEAMTTPDLEDYELTLVDLAPAEPAAGPENASVRSI